MTLNDQRNTLGQATSKNLIVKEQSKPFHSQALHLLIMILE